MATRTVENRPVARQTASTTGSVHSIGIAAIKVVQQPDRIRTVLGSCVGVALFDSVAGIGGLAHVILPDSQEGSGDPGKFADTAVDLLLEGVLAAGAKKARLVAKIAGGAAMFGGETAASLGRRNAIAVEQRLRERGIQLTGSAVGGTKGRRMMLDPASGDVLVEIIGESPQQI